VIISDFSEKIAEFSKASAFGGKTAPQKLQPKLAWTAWMATMLGNFLGGIDRC
jgi:hypothetical protein